MEQERGNPLLHAQRFGDERARVLVRLRVSMGDEADQRLRLAESRIVIGELGRVELQHLPHHPAQMASRIRVVTHEGDALRSEMATDERDQRVAHVRRNPGIHAMRDDVIEGAGVFGKAREIERLERYVRNPRAPGKVPGRLDGVAGEIDSHERAALQHVRHRDEIPAVATAHLEHATAIRRRRGHPVKRGRRRQAVRVGVRVGHAGIADGVVRGHGGCRLQGGGAERLYRIARMGWDGPRELHSSTLRGEWLNNPMPCDLVRVPGFGAVLCVDAAPGGECGQASCHTRSPEGE